MSASQAAQENIRFDFGPKLCPTWCSHCGVLTRNRGCQTCGSIFCKVDFSEHCIGGCVHSVNPAAIAMAASAVSLTTESLVVLGESSVGKTSIVRRYTEKTFASDLPMTMGVDFKRTRLLLHGVDVVQSIWDTAGQECFRTIIPQYYKKASGIILVYDVTSVESFEKMQHWLEQIKLHAQKDVKTLLLGNKADLEELRAVDEARGRALAHEHDMLFFESSAKTGLHVHEGFVAITEAILRQRSEEELGN